jgi:hypothetical protein
MDRTVTITIRRAAMGLHARSPHARHIPIAGRRRGRVGRKAGHRIRASTSGELHLVTDAERDRLVAFLQSKQCGPCRRGDAKLDHGGCVEAEELIKIVERG